MRRPNDMFRRWSAGRAVPLARLACLAVLVLSAPACRDWERFSDAPCTNAGAPAVCVATVACDRCMLFCLPEVPIEEAVAVCDGWGAKLAEPREPELEDCMREQVPFGTPATWVGLFQAMDQPTNDVGWAWSDGTEFAGRWSEGEPNDSQEPEEENDENCAIVTRELEGVRDAPCLFVTSSILCERPPPP